MKNKLSIKMNSEYIISIFLDIALFFMLCIYEPLTLYFNNQSDYPCDFYEIFPECLRMFSVLTACTAVLLLILYLFFKKYYHYLLGFLLWIYICLYIQGNYMVSKLPVLDGRYIDWSQYTNQIIFSSCFWLAMLILCITCSIKIRRKSFTKIAGCIGIFISLVLLATGITVGISQDGFQKRLELAITSKNMLEYSNDTNFILLVMDSMDAETETQILQTFPEYREALCDFTYYDNVTPGYLYTSMALPHLYGGERYIGQTAFSDYLSRTYLESEFVQELEKRNYRLHAFTSEIPLNDASITKYENIINYKSGVVDHIAFCKVLLRMTGYKYAPYALKRYTQVLPGELNSHLQKPAGIRVWDFWESNIPFYNECQNCAFNATSPKCFKLIHLSAAHYPFAYTKDVEAVTYSSYEDNMACSNTIMAAYLEKLKDEGLYDNSVIFITADHGISEDDNVYKRMNPVLFVKGIGEQHNELLVNHAPITHDDFQQAFFRLLDAAKSNEIFDWNEGDKRDRSILIEYNSSRSLAEHIQTGNASDTETLYKSGTVYSIK